MPLAVSSYRDLQALADGREALSLAWTVDEQACLAVDLASVLRDEITRCRQDPALCAPAAACGGDRIAEAAFVAALRAGPWPAIDGCAIRIGAGVNALLHALSRLVGEDTAYVVGDVYPDFPHWVELGGGRCEHGAADLTIAEHVERARRCAARVVLLDRPNLFGRDPTLPELRELARANAERGALVIVDESYANYCEPAFSAINIVPEAANLCVLRGLSKAYQLGGLRLGYAIADPQADACVGSVIADGQVAALSLRLGASVLALGDIAGRLRERIALHRPVVVSLLADLGIDCSWTAAPLPYVFVDDLETAPDLLQRRGVIGKRHVSWPGAAGVAAQRFRLSVPLLPERLEALRRRLGPH